MIQRIQSVFYFLASTSFGGFFALPFATSSNNQGSFFSDGIYNINDNVSLLLVTIAGIIAGMAALLLFKNRSLQKRIGTIGIVISILMPVLAALLVFKEASSINTDNLNDGLALYLPILCIVFFALGNRYVNKDEKIVKSMDRLR